jgi:hypothetical protein
VPNPINKGRGLGTTVQGLRKMYREKQYGKRREKIQNVQESAKKNAPKPKKNLKRSEIDD